MPGPIVKSQWKASHRLVVYLQRYEVLDDVRAGRIMDRTF